MGTPVNDRYEDELQPDVSLLAIDQYIRAVRWSQFLTREEETVLLERLLRAKQHPGNAWYVSLAKDARERLVVSYQGLVLFFARKYVCHFRTMDLLDVVQEGTIGLLQAIDDVKSVFPPEFYAFASTCIMRAIFRALRLSDNLMHIPANIVEALFALNRVRYQLSLKLDREPSVQELACALQKSPEKVSELLEVRKRYVVASLHALFREERAEDTYHFAPLHAPEEYHERTQMQFLVQEAIQAVLTPRQRQYIMLRYGFDGGQSLSYRQVANILGVRCDAVHQSEKSAKKKLLSALAPALSLASDALSA